jgi:LmbE family N-acetylglucosaminyl deacetylase
MGRHRLAAVFAHPDDDTWMVGGTYLLEGGDLDLTVVVATSGEAGMIADASMATRESLAQVREGEERAALAAGGQGGADVRFFRYPDGGLGDVDPEELVRRIADVLRTARPEVVVTFGPDGGTGHADHIVVSRATTEAFHRVREEPGAEGAFLRLLYGSLPQSGLDELYARWRSRGVEVDPDAPFMPRAVPDGEIAVSVDTTAVARAKYEALMTHETQAPEIQAIADPDHDLVFSAESFVRAWPPRVTGADPPVASVFEGLST